MKTISLFTSKDVAHSKQIRKAHPPKIFGKTARFLLSLFVLVVLLFSFSSISSAGLNDGLVAYYPFNGNADDESSNENNGTVNGATLTEDRFGNIDSAYDFDGSNDRIDIGQPIPAVLQMTAAFTISVWVKPDAYGNAGGGNLGGIVASQYDPAHSGYSLMIEYRTNPPRGIQGGAHFQVGTGSNWWATSTEGTTNVALSTGQWTHITAVAETDNTYKVYFNGILVADWTAQNSIVFNNACHFLIGDNQHGGSDPRYFDGAIDDVRIYNRALSEAEIQELYNENEEAYNVLLIHSDTNDGSMVFEDSSSSNHPITANGDVHHDTAQAKFGNSSIYFDGDGDYLSVDDSDNWNFENNNFTIDFQVQFNSISDTIYFCGARENENLRWLFGRDGNKLYFFVVTEPGVAIVDIHTDSDWSPEPNRWYHLAVIRGWGGNINDYAITVDGVAVATGTDDSTFPDYASVLRIGCGGGYTGYEKYLDGYIDEFRISKGIARWTENFTPPVSSYGEPQYITATIDHTKIDQDLTDFPVLIHLADQSGTNQFDATAMFDELDNGIDARTVLSIHSDTEDGSTVFEDSSSSNHVLTPNGDVHHDAAQAKFGNSSMYFDGDGDYLSLSSESDAWNFGADDFTIDLWVYPTASKTYHSVFNTRSAFGNEYNVYLYTQHAAGSGNIFCGFKKTDGTDLDLVGSQAQTLNQWQHIAIVRNGNTAYLFKDGVEIGTLDVTGVTLQTPTGLTIGTDLAVSPNDFSGYIDEIRISKGVARWTSNFTPPNRPYNDGTKKIAVYDQNNNLCYAEVEHWDSANKKAWLWVKVPQVSSTEDTVLSIYYDKNSPDNLAYVGEASDALNYQMVVDIGSEGTYDTANVTSPFVIKDGDIYKMWYYGHDGSNGRILYATSQDGINWSDHQMVVDNGTEGTYDTQHAYTPRVIKDGDTYEMWYSGHNGSNWRILYATSQDGINWSNHQMVVDIGSQGTYDTVHAYAPFVIKDGDTYKMWYTGSVGSNLRILYATSSDGITWSEHQMVMDIGSEGTYDTVQLHTPYVIKDGNTYKIWYYGYDGSNGRILYATSPDGITWSDYQMVVDISTEGTYDTVNTFSPHVIKDGDTYKMWYAGYDGTNWRIIFSQSYTPTWKTPSQNVWDNNFVGVWHMAQDPDGDMANAVKDSTKNAHHGTPSGSMSTSDLIDGKIGKAIDLDGTDDYINIGYDRWLGDPNLVLTVEALFQGIGNIVAAQRDSSNVGDASFGITSDNSLRYYIDNNPSPPYSLSFTANIDNYDPSSEFVYAGWSMSGSNSYFCGNDSVSNVDVSFSYPGSFEQHSDIMLGRHRNYIWGTSYADIVYDEIRISDIPRSTAWIKATFHSNFDELISYSSGGDTTAPPEVTTLTVNPEGDGTSVTLDWSGYDEAAAGDIAYYRIYVETSEFSDIPETPFATVAAGQFTYTASGLDRDQTYYFAIVAVDYAGNAISTVTTPPVVETPTDVEPPEDVTNLQVEPFKNRLVFTWDHSANTDGDLAGYKIYFNGDTSGITLSPDQSTYKAAGLEPDTDYDIKVAAYDNNGNESIGVTLTGRTLLATQLKPFIVTIDHEKIDANLTDFPILIHLAEESGTNSFDALPLFDELDHGIDDFTVLSIHSDTDDGSTVFEDSSSSNHLLTPNGNVHHDAAQAKFGGSSMNFDDEGDYLEIPDSPDWDFGTDPFTIDFWVNFNIIPTSTLAFINHGGGGENINEDGWFLQWSAAGCLYWRYREGANNYNKCENWSPDANTWYHIAVTRDQDNNLRMFVDGVELGSTTSSYNYSISSYNGVLNVGTSSEQDDQFLNGYIDELRVSKGIARWTSNFTPPNRPYSDDLKKFSVYTTSYEKCYTEIESWDSVNKEAWLWVKVPQVSSTEDTQLYMSYNKDSADNVTHIGEAADALSYQMVMDIGSEGTYDTVAVTTQCVVQDGDIYKMWYTGYNGSNGRILYATSPDGITWSNRQMVVNIGSEGTYDTEYVYSPSVIKDGDTYKMWFAGYDGANWRIIYATSPDGITWSDHQMVVDIGAEGTYDTVRTSHPHVFKDGDTYKMWYSGHNGSNWRILYATSPDGINWSNHQMVVDIGSQGIYDTVSAFSPHFIKDGDTYKMWYSGQDSSKYTTLYATSSDGITWSDHQMVVDIASEGTYDSLLVMAPCVIKNGDMYRMWYAGYDGTNWRIISSQSFTPTWKTPSQNVWDNSFVGIWHMAQDPTGGTGAVKDSTKNASHGTAQDMESADLVDSQVGKGLTFEGPVEFVNSPNMGIYNEGSFEVLFYYTDYPGTEHKAIIGDNSVVNARRKIIDTNSWNNDEITMLVEQNDGTNQIAAYNIASWVEGWYSAAGVWNNSFIKLFTEGVLRDTYSSPVLPTSSDYEFGIAKAGSYGFNDKIDEVRISSIVRSEAWIKATFHSNFDDLIAYTYTDDITPPPEVDTLTVNPEGDGTSVTLDWSGYDESAAGDIAYYRICVETSDFSDIPETPFATVAAGQFTYTAGDLNRDQTYYFAVVAVDHSGNAIASVSTPPVNETPTDVEPPEDVTNLQVTCAENSLTFTWDHSADTAGDLAGYKVYFDGDIDGVALDASQNSYAAPDLSPATSYDFKITAVDASTNESAGVTTDGATLLDNPANLTPTPNYGRIELTWDSVAPADLVQTYALYMSQSPFTSVDGMTPELTTTDTSAGIGSLANNTTYYFAVTTINISNGEQKNVTTVSAVPLSATYVSGHITSDITWTLAGSPYIVTGDVTVRSSVFNNPGAANTLTIEPGVVVRFNPGTGLYIGDSLYYGALSAQGTEGSPVIFTSNAATPAAGDWKGIYFRDVTDDGASIMEHCVVEYGGQSHNSNIYCASASPTIKNSTIRYSSSNGIYLNGSSNPIIGGEANGNTITNNSSYGIYSADATPFPVISYNTVSDNGSYAIRVGAMMNNVGSNVCSGNGVDGIELLGEPITTNLTWKTNSVPYVVTGDVTVRSSVFNNPGAANTLTIEPGVVVRFNPGTGLYIGDSLYYGALSAQGTEGSPVIFTSNAATPAAGDWKGIYFRDVTDDSASIMEHCVVEYGGHTHNSNIYCASASPTINNSTIRYSNQYGIYCNASSPTIAGNNITNNTGDGIYSNDSSYALITDNIISDNGGSAIHVHPDCARNIDGNSGSGNGQNYIKVRAGHVLSSGTWKKQDLPYVIAGDVTVRSSVFNNPGAANTLTIEPGVVVRFNPGTGLYIGDSLYYGALAAQGTEQSPITFTSNAATPAAGDWKGIYFRSVTNDGASIVENCVVEYGGHTNNANVYLENAAPTLQYNTIRNSSHSGIYVNGTGCNNTTINCNNLKDNLYGVYSTNNAQPQVSGNNFLRSQNYGLYNAGSATVNAESNWWGDVNGPGYNGDDVYGNVDYDPWRTTESDCISAPPTNTPPFTPKNPSPADNAVRVPVIQDSVPLDVTLSWTGGDPNPWDTVVYDVYIGEAADSLAIEAEGISVTSYAKSGLDEGVTYYWQIVSRDDAGGQTDGPIWQFTTLGAPPDLTVTAITWEPSTDLAAGQTVTFTATIENAGTGPVVDAFQVVFKIDGSSISTKSISPVIDAGASFQLTQTWTASIGDHTIEVVADSSESVTEAFEENNSLTESLPTVSDPAPPALVSTSPTSGAVLTQVNQIVITLADAHGTVDDAAVIAGFALRDGSSQLVAVTSSEANDVFTFVPDSLPLADDTYSVSLTAADTFGNTQPYSFTFTVDGQPPAQPTITGGTITSGLIQARPFADNRSKTTSVTLTGTREANTSVWINGSQRVVLGSGDWSVNLTLSQGDNALEIFLKDAANNQGTSEWVDIFVDSTAPAVTNITPADNSFLNAAPATVVVDFQETGSGLSPDNSAKSVKDGSLTYVAGTWTVSGGNQLIFTPEAALADSYYTVDIQLEDALGNRGSALQYHFTVDTAAPPVPVINPVTSPAYNPTQVISGTKEAYAAIMLNGAQAIDHIAATTWQHTVTLVSGTNQFTFAARDRAGNQSDDVIVTIVYDDIPPPPVTTLLADGSGSGTTVALDWSGYNESAHGDIASYRIYVETSSFSNVSGLTEHATVSAGTFTYTVANLTKGTPYWFAVTAVDLQDHADPAVQAVEAVPTDIVAPEDVTNLSVESFDDRLVFSWTPAADTQGDLAGYKVYFNNDPTGVALPATSSSYEQTGLDPATAYPFKVAAFDTNTTANESAGVTLTGVTRLDNPTGLAAVAYSGYVDLTWNAAAPAPYVKHYNVYVSETDFTSVAGLTPQLSTAATSANVAGLTNNTTYYFAVTTVNVSDGERPEVAAIAATPEADTQGPEITNVEAGDAPLVSGQTLDQSVIISADAVDPSGVSRVEFHLDGSLIRTDFSADYSCYLDVVSLDDGAYTLTITAFDTLGNSTPLEYTINVALPVPAAPIITQPADGLVTNQPQVTVSGQAEKNAEVILYNNDAPTGDESSADVSGSFSFLLTLTEGANRIQAAARNRAGTGPLSTEVVVTLDTSIPYSPTGLTAQSQESGAVKLTWQAPTGTTVAGYNIYRAASSFTTVAEAVKVNTNLVLATAFTDLPPADGTWYYRVTTVDNADNESDVSAEASAQADSTAPRAALIEYTPQGNYDPVTERMAPGTVDLVLTVSEPLQAAPFLSINPEGGTPISIELTQADAVTYTGFFVISETTPTGTAWAIFSARDIAGNRGTEIDAGASIQIDTDGPAITRLVISPLSPLKNDAQNPVAVTVSIGLNEAVKPGTVPQLWYLLSKDGREATIVDAVTQIDTVTGDVETWQAFFELLADAGLDAPESFTFIFEAADDLDNVSDSIAAANLFQVYQGELPPLEPPQGLAWEAGADGQIHLTWEPVSGAAAYQLYRYGPLADGETPDINNLTEYLRLDVVEAYTDTPDADGDYLYTVASIRSENGQESPSAMSNMVQAVSDRVAPYAPGNLTLALAANGILAQWDAPAYTEPVTYQLYREDLAEITAVEGLTPLIVGIPATQVVDPNPSTTEHCYVVTAVDASGNESAPSNFIYENFGLLPVSSLTVVQTDNGSPQISWTHPSSGSIAGYDLYLGDRDTGVKLHSDHLTGLSYSDVGYAGDERTYTLIAVDASEAESLGRSITLPMMQADLDAGARLKRGIMNRLEYIVANLSADPVTSIRLKVDVASRAHFSDKFDLEGGQSATVPVIVGGYDDLGDLEVITTTIEITPNTGETVQIVRSSQIEVTDGMLVLQILNEEFTRGAFGSVRFTLENTGEAEIEIITAENGGNSASSQVKYYLLDEDENVIASTAFKQVIGSGIVTLSNGNSVARVAAGATFTAELTTIPIPANAPDNVIVKLAIESIYYHQGQTTQVKMDGLATTHPVTLIDTSYYGEVTDITPPNSTGDQPIVISGRAVERTGGDPLPEVALNLVITLNGFERSYEVLTGDDGTFAHTFTPLAGEAGVYTVRAVHPDLTDRPVHGQFVITRVSVAPTVVNLGIPYNFEKTVNIQVQCGDGTEISNLHLVYDAADQPGGVYPAGVHVTLGDAVALVEAGQSAGLPLTVWADNTAEAAGALKVKVISDETGTEPWATVTVNTSFSEALPVLNFTPDHIETGLARDATVTESIVLQNNGLAAMHDVTLALIAAGGGPAPDWVYLNSPAAQGSLEVGASRQVSVAFAPTDAVSEGMYTFYLRVTASNYQTVDIGLYVSVTQSGIGNVLFKVSDIYTGTLDADDQIIQGLAGAKVWVQNEAVLTEEYTLTTDSLGEAYFTDLPAGQYKCRITANNHQEYIGRVWIKPGITANAEVFLNYNLVTVEWEVNEITIQDKYEIVLTAVYETDVPAAVVIAEPTAVNLPAMAAGDVYNGEFTVTNHGLVRADNVSFTLPQDDQYFDFEFLGGLPSSLNAKEKITVPYRVTCLLAPDQSGEGGGGGCERAVSCAMIDYDYTCPAGQVFHDSALACFIYDNGECTGGGGAPGPTGGGGDVVWNVGGGTGGGSSVSAPAPAPSQIAGVKCFPTCSLKESFFDKLRSWKETLSNMIHQVGCTVNTLTREFNDDATDLAVKVPGGTIEVQRRFYRDQWHWDNTRNNLTFKLNSLGTGIESIEKGGVVYEATATGSDVFTHDTYRITKTGSVYQWKDKYGNYKDFDETGRMTAYGTLSGVVGKLVYEAGENGKLIGIADRNDNQVIWYEYDGNGRIEAVYDVDNRRVEYTYTDGRLTMVTDVLDNPTTYEYNSGGQITRKVDAGGRPTIITYDEYNNPVSVVDNQGKGHFFEYNYNSAKKEYYARLRTSAGMIKEIWYDRNEETKRVDVNGRTIMSIAKDGRNLLITDEKGNITRKDFDEWDNLTKVTYPNGTTVLFEYDLRFNKVSRVTDPRGNISEYVYDDQGNLTEKTEAIGSDAERVTTYTYDDAGQLLTATIAADADTAAATTTFTYDDSGNLATITDPMDHVTQFVEYDNMGNLLRMIDPRNNEWTFAYDDMGRLLSQTDPLNNTTAYEYDGANNRTAIVNAYLKRFEFEYDDHNNLIKAIDPYTKFITTDFNTDNLPTKITDQEGKISRTEYDNEGRITKSIDGAGNEIVFHYDETDATLVSSYRPIQIDYPTYTRKFIYDKMQRVTVESDVLDENTTHTRSYTYDAAGNVITSTDEQSKTTQFEYDSLNRLVKTTDPMSGETRRKYDDRGNLIELQDPNSGITFYEYDKNNRLVKTIRPMLEETTYEYDEVGNRTAVNDTKGQRIEYTYNAINRLTQVRYYAAGDHQNPIKTVDFTYDDLGNILTYADGITSATYTYDDLSRKTGESIEYGPFALSYSYTYYDNGVKKTFTGPEGNTITYTYDENNRLVGTNIPGQGQINNIYDEAHWNSPAKTMLPGGSTTDYGYDPLMQLGSITAKDPGQNPLMTRSYQYSPAGNITAKDTEHGNYTYQYDDLYRLIQAVNPTLPDEAYTYDALGNRLTAAGVSGNWTYNANNELTGYDTNAFAYDDNGNLTQKNVDGVVTNFVYDTEDRLVRVEDGSANVVAEYYYDPFGRRLWKDVDGTKTYFLYSDEGLIGEYDAVGTEIKTYGWVPDSTWSTDPLFVKIAGIYYWYQNDHLGTPQKITRTNGSVVWSATYDSFGNCQIDTADITNNLRLPGMYFDAETGLYYNYNRYYDPTIGRYLRVDPQGDGLNLYAYVFNNPITLIDPLGLCAVSLLPTGAEIAEAWQQSAYRAGQALGAMVESNPDTWPLAASIQTAMDVGGGFVDLLRFGEGAAEGGWGYGKDILRGVGIATMAYGSLSRVAATPKSGTEVVQRAMSKAELDYLQEHGTLRFGKAGTELDPHFVSDAVNADLTRTRLRLALPKTPEVRVTLEVEKGVFGTPTTVKPLDLGKGRILPGGGTERTATGVVRARVLKFKGF